MVVEAMVDVDGTASDARIVSSTNPWLDKAAIEAVLRQKHPIPMKDGKPTRAVMRVPISFTAPSDEEIEAASAAAAASGDSVEFVADDDMPGYDPAEFVSNVVYPLEALDKNIQGEVIVRCVIEKDGTPSNIIILQSSHPILNQAAIDAVKKTKFTPGKYQGEPLRVNMTIPVTFKIH